MVYVHPALEQLDVHRGVQGRSLNGYSEIYGDKLVVYAIVSDTEKAFDIYDAATGDYEYSVSIPWGRIYFASYDPIGKRVWQVRDTTVAVYSVDPQDVALGNAHLGDSGPESLPSQ